MEKFVFIGQSAAILSAIKTLRTLRPESSITLISCDGTLPYDRELFSSLLARKIKEKDLLLETEGFYKTHKVEAILDREITRINFTRQKIFLSERGQIEYDVLVMGDTPSARWPEIKGIRRTGVFHTARLDTVKALVRYLPFAETVALESIDLKGIEIALALKAMGKEVFIVTPDKGILGSTVSEEVSILLASLLQKKGIRLFAGNSVEDVLGEAEVKAVRLKSGKVIACDMVVFDNVIPDLRFLNEGELIMTERVNVTSTLQSNIQSVYAIDTVCHMESPRFIGGYATSRVVAERQGEVAVKAALGENIAFEGVSVGDENVPGKLFTADEIAEAQAGLAASASQPHPLEPLQS